MSRSVCEGYIEKKEGIRGIGFAARPASEYEKTKGGALEEYDLRSVSPTGRYLGDMAERND
jgi:hypothetical protein